MGVLLSANTNLALMDESGVLTLPETVTAIGEGAFADLSGLKTINNTRYSKGNKAKCI